MSVNLLIGRLCAGSRRLPHQCLLPLLRRQLLTSSLRPQRRPKLILAPAVVAGDPVADPPNDEQPPVLFIQKYECLVDLGLAPNPVKQRLDDQTKEDSALTEETLTQRKIKHVMRIAKKSKTFDKLEEALRDDPDPLFSPPLKAASTSPGLGNSIFVDEEAIRSVDSDSVKLASDDLLKWADTRLQLRKLPAYYMMLSKARLTLLVVSTTAAGYGLAPGAFDPSILALCTVGTGLISCSANSINQYLEVPFDSQMNRTKNRVLVRGYLSPLHAMTFAAVTAVSGTLLLACQVNVVAAGLGVANLFLYTCIYTPMKRVSILNTWVGSVVGAIPPIIGWASATGGLDAGALVLGGILFAWQFPHFNSLSWNLRPDYSKAGYRMMSVTDPDLCRRVALRYSIGCVAICSAAPALDVTNIAFALDSLPLNLYLVYLSWRFYQKADSSSSRKLFRYTLIHLPLLMTLMFISKKRKGEPSNNENMLPQ